MKNIFIVDMKLVNNNINKNGILLNCFTNTNKSIEIHKINNNIKFILYDNIGNDYTITVPNSDNIETIYFEMIPYMNKHISIYINKKFYSYNRHINIKNRYTNLLDTPDTPDMVVIQNSYKYIYWRKCKITNRK